MGIASKMLDNVSGEVIVMCGIILCAIYISSLIGKFFPSYPFSSLYILVSTALDASLKKKVFNPFLLI